MGPRVDALERLLLEDLDLLERDTRTARDARRQSIRDAYAAIRGYVDQRVAWLRSALQ